AATPRHLHSFPTRRSSDLTEDEWIGLQINPKGASGAKDVRPSLSIAAPCYSSAIGAVQTAGAPAIRRCMCTILIRSRLPLGRARSEEHTSELQSPCNLVCR